MLTCFMVSPWVAGVCTDDQPDAFGGLVYSPWWLRLSMKSLWFVGIDFHAITGLVLGSDQRRQGKRCQRQVDDG